jgi:hypothetical protein
LVTAAEHTRRHAAEYAKQGKGWACGRRVVEGLPWLTERRKQAKRSK